MPNPTYIFNPSDGLYHPVIVTGTGDNLNLDISPDGGLLNPPPYIAVVGESLISTETYLIATRQTDLGMTEAEFNFFAVGVSDLVESYCGYSWRISATPVPVGLQKVVAEMIKASIDNAGQSNLCKSESMTGLTYTLADGVQHTDILSGYKSALSPFRQLHIWM